MQRDPSTAASASSRTYSSSRKIADDRKGFAPQTPPQRFISSNFSSPGSVLSKEEDTIIVELSSRHLLAGIEGESGPHCKVYFTPDSARRVGDHRAWSPNYKRKAETLDNWGYGYELWRNDIDKTDLNLVGDWLERTMRDVYNKRLLVDAGTARLVLVLPSIVPHPVIETILATLFERWKYPTITLLPVPAMLAVGAGVRSALVVDIGWEETTVTAIYEYRDVKSRRSAKGYKSLTYKVAALLKGIQDANKDLAASRFDLAFVEDFLTRVLPVVDLNVVGTATHASTVPDDASHPSTAVQEANANTIEVEWPGTASTMPVLMSRSALDSALLETFLDVDEDLYPDDHETALPRLMHKTLSMLAPDVRGMCMARIIFTGYAADVTGLRNRLLSQLSQLVEKSGWRSVKSENLTKQRAGIPETARVGAIPNDTKDNILWSSNDEVLGERVRKQKPKTGQQIVQGVLRELSSVGAWTGASLLTSLKIDSFVQIERERFLSHGLAGANRDSEISVVPQPKRMSTFGMTTNKVPDRNSWTLAGWG